jgi:hypothetical protein
MVVSKINPNTQKTLVVTKTGEPFQPVRIYFQVAKPKTVIGAFKKLRCMGLNPHEDRWDWFYADETRKLRFDIPFNALPKDEGFIILGYFKFLSDEQLILDLRSFDRAIYALEFFEKRINRWAARMTHIRIINRFYSADEVSERTPLSSLLENVSAQSHKRAELDETLQGILAEYEEDEEGRLNAITAYLEAEAKRPLPEAEDIPLHIYEDGFGPIATTLKMRQIEAYEHWQGNTSFSQFDLLQRLMDFAPEDDELELDDLTEMEPLEAEAIEVEAIVLEPDISSELAVETEQEV